MNGQALLPTLQFHDTLGIATQLDLLLKLPETAQRSNWDEQIKRSKRIACTSMTLLQSFASTHCLLSALNIYKLYQFPEPPKTLPELKSADRVSCFAENRVEKSEALRER